MKVEEKKSEYWTNKKVREEERKIKWKFEIEREGGRILNLI